MLGLVFPGSEPVLCLEQANAVLVHEAREDACPLDLVDAPRKLVLGRRFGQRLDGAPPRTTIPSRNLVNEEESPVPMKPPGSAPTYGVTASS